MSRAATGVAAENSELCAYRLENALGVVLGRRVSAAA